MNCTGQNRPYTPINGNNQVQVSEKEAPNNLLRPSLISDRHFSFCFSSLPTGWAHTRGEIADPNKNCKWRSVSSSTGGGALVRWGRSYSENEMRLHTTTDKGSVEEGALCLLFLSFHSLPFILSLLFRLFLS